MASARLNTMTNDDDDVSEDFIDEIVNAFMANTTSSKVMGPAHPSQSISGCYLLMRCGNSEKMPIYIDNLYKAVMSDSKLSIPDKLSHLKYCYEKSIFFKDIKGSVRYLEKANELIILSKDYSKQNAELVLANQKTIIALKNSLKGNSDKSFAAYDVKQEENEINALCKSTHSLYGSARQTRVKPPLPAQSGFKNMAYVRKSK